MKKKFSTIFFVGFLIVNVMPRLAFAQTGIVEGTVKDKNTGEYLVGSNVVIIGTQLGAAVDLDGYFIVRNIPQGTYNIEVSMIGYITIAKEIIISRDRKVSLDFLLEETVISQPGVIVTAERLIEKTSVSAQSITGSNLRRTHGFAEDPMRSLTAMPGIAIGEEFSTWLCVRGGAPNENLWLLDWVPVYWPYHFGGMKSVFNSEIIENLELYTGGFPPKFGDKLSSVINITTREGSRDSFTGKANLSLINALGLVEGPVTQKGSYILSARRSYYDLIIPVEEGFTVPTFYDIQTLVAYDLAPGQKFNLSGLVSGEKARVEFEEPTPEQPKLLEDYYFVTTSSAAWRWLITPELYSMLALIFQSANIQVEMNQFWVNSRIWEIGVREDLAWELNDYHTLKTGFEFRRPKVDWQSFIPLSPLSNKSWADTTLQGYRSSVKGNLWLGSIYMQDAWDILPQLSTNFGMRYDNNSMTLKGKISPRVSIRYEFDVATAIRGAYGYYYQIHELEEMAENRELDTKLAKHYILGLERKITHEVKSWIEVYYKDYCNLITSDSSGQYESDGFGYAKGLELFLQKKGKPFSGWISYALSWAERKHYLDEEIGWFDFDQRNMISALLDFEFGKTWYFGLHWRYASGKPYTPVVQGVQDTLGHWLPVNGEKNSERYPNYHRLDVTANKEFSFWGLKPVLYVKVLNAYYRKNIQGYSYSYEEDGTPIRKPYYGMPIIPAVGFSVAF